LALRERRRLNKYYWKYIILDEGHRTGKPDSKFASVLSTQYLSDRRILLTGAPLSSNPNKLWGQLNFIHSRAFGCCEDFSKRFEIVVCN
jgi:SNF2 family DNA or RNA helicase